MTQEIQEKGAVHGHHFPIDQDNVHRFVPIGQYGQGTAPVKGFQEIDAGPVFDAAHAAANGLTHFFAGLGQQNGQSAQGDIGHVVPPYACSMCVIS